MEVKAVILLRSPIAVDSVWGVLPNGYQRLDRWREVPEIISREDFDELAALLERRECKFTLTATILSGPMGLGQEVVFRIS